MAHRPHERNSFEPQTTVWQNQASPSNHDNVLALFFWGPFTLSSGLTASLAMSHESEINPFAPTKTAMSDVGEPRRVPARPLELLGRAKALVGEQYWLFVGICFVGVLIASLIPFGLATGAMMIGIFHAFHQREAGLEADFNHLFKGFDQFVDGFLVTLMMLALNFAIMIPVVILFIVGSLIPAASIAQSGGGPEAAGMSFVFFMLLLYPTIIVLGVLTYVPFTFAFQLVADRKMTAWEAVTTSFSAAMKNFFSVLWLIIVLSFVNMIAAIACYVPALLLFPLTVGAIHIYYRDVFGQAVQPGESPFGAKGVGDSPFSN